MSLNPVSQKNMRTEKTYFNLSGLTQIYSYNLQPYLWKAVSNCILKDSIPLISIIRIYCEFKSSFSKKKKKKKWVLHNIFQRKWSHQSFFSKILKPYYWRAELEFKSEERIPWMSMKIRISLNWNPFFLKSVRVTTFLRSDSESAWKNLVCTS